MAQSSRRFSGSDSSLGISLMIMIFAMHAVTEFVNGRVKRRGSTELQKFRT